MDVPRQEEHVDLLPLRFWVRLSEEQQNLATNWSLVFIEPQPFKKIFHYSEGREVRDADNNVGVCDLQRIEDAHAVLIDVDDRQQAFRQQS